MANIITDTTAIITSIPGIAGLFAFGLSIYWSFNKRAKQRDLIELRNKLDELKPTDPEYNETRALYTSMMIDAHRWDFFHSLGHDTNSYDHSMGSHDSGHSGFDGGGDSGHH